VTLIYTDWSGQEGCRHESTLRVAPETYDVWIDLADGAVSDLFPGDSVQVIARYGVRHADGYGKDNTEHDISYEWKWAVQRYDEDNDDYIDIDPDSADCPVTFTPENDHLLIGTEEGITGQMRILPTVTLYVDGEERARTYAGEPEICVKEDLMQIQIGQLNTELSVGETTQADFTLIRKYLENHDGNIAAYTDRTPPYYDDDSPQEWGFAVLYDPAVLEVKANGETLQPVIFTEDGCDFWEVSEYYEYRKQHSSPYVLPVTRTPATLSVTKLKEGTNAGLILWAVRYGSYDDGSDDEMWCVQLYKNWDEKKRLIRAIATSVAVVGGICIIFALGGSALFDFDREQSIAMMGKAVGDEHAGADLQRHARQHQLDGVGQRRIVFHQVVGFLEIEPVEPRGQPYDGGIQRVRYVHKGCRDHKQQRIERHVADTQQEDGAKQTYAPLHDPSLV
jgi:hypothetical protein